MNGFKPENPPPGRWQSKIDWLRAIPRIYPLTGCIAIGLIIFIAVGNFKGGMDTVDGDRAANGEQPLTGENPAVDTQTPPEAGDFEVVPHVADVIPVESQAAMAEIAGYFTPYPKARILIVRGILTVFSLGMDDLAKKLRKEGYDVQVSTAAQSSQAARKLRDYIHRTNDSTPLIIIGHSLGGDLAPRLARTFSEKNVPVDMLIMLDSTMPSSPPANVKRCVNLYQSNITPDWAPIFRGSRIDKHATETEMYNIDIRELAGKDRTAGINHFNIDANPWVHDLIIDAVKQADTTSYPQFQRNYVPVKQNHPGARHFRISDQTESQSPPRNYDYWKSSGYSQPPVQAPRQSRRH